MTTDPAQMPEKHWTNATIDEAFMRADGAAEVTLPIEQFIELLTEVKVNRPLVRKYLLSTPLPENVFGRADENKEPRG